MADRLNAHRLMQVRSAALSVGRSVWKLKPFERLLARLTLGRPYGGFVSKLPPLWTSYRAGQSVRRVRRGGIEYELDLSELSEWWHYWGFEDDAQAVVSMCRPGMLALDVGAHIGFFTLPIAQAIGSNGHVHAIEPDPVNFVKLQRHLDLNPTLASRVTTHNLAVSDRRQELRIASPIPHNRASRISTDGEPIRAIPLDELEISPDLVKIDIEGYETKALAGASTTLRHRPPMFVEVNDPLLREAGSSAAELLNALHALGYSTTDHRTGRPVSTAVTSTDVVCTAREEPALSTNSG